MKPIVPLTAFAAALLFAMPQESQAQQGPQPGLWKVTTKTLIAGVPPRESTHTSCITPEMAKNPGAGFTRGEQTSRPDCKQAHTITGSTLSWRIECSGQNAMVGTGTIKFASPTHYAGAFTVSVTTGPRPMEVTTTLDGQRVGECPK